MDFDQQCKGALCAGKGYAYYDVGLTGLSVLAFLGAGHTHTSRDTYLDTQTGKTVVMGEVVKGGLRWLIDQQDEMGCVGSKSSLKYIYNHAIACMALAEAYAMTRSDLFRAPAQKAVDFLLASQNPGRGWRYQARSGETDTSVTGWCFMALRVAEMAGLQVDRTTCATASRYMADVTDSHGLTGYMSRDDAGIKVVVPGRNEDFVNHQTMTALSIFCLLFPDTAARAGSHAAGANALTTDLPTWDREHKTNDYYYWYYGTYALFTYDGPSGPDWQRWNEALIVALLPNQLSRRNGCSEGSWDADDRWGFEGGRVYATALNTLTLEVYYRYASLRGR
ncbi:MAG: hypothetical protein HYZ53_25695 [Planctomycetes bacterium]|nr:hypothetical protein [Planctomycetota bacterium]